MARIAAALPKAAKKATAKQPSLLDIVRQTPPPRAKNWLNRLTPEARDEILQLRQEFMDGKLPQHITARMLYGLVIERYPEVGISDSHFRRWIAGKP